MKVGARLAGDGGGQGGQGVQALSSVLKGQSLERKTVWGWDLGRGGTQLECVESENPESGPGKMKASPLEAGSAIERSKSGACREGRGRGWS